MIRPAATALIRRAWLVYPLGSIPMPPLFALG